MMRRILLLTPLLAVCALPGCWNFNGGVGNDNDNDNDNDNNDNVNANDNTNGNVDPITGEFVENYLVSGERQVDLLFVIDNSGSMAGEQELLRENFAALMNALRNMFGGLPDLHVGVTSTDLGTGLYSIIFCEDVGGDAGNLLTGTCANPTGRPYIIDVEPQGCDIYKTPDNTCQSHTCDASHCTPLASFSLDAATGCPRCRNYTGESLEEVFSCLGDLGTEGCGFEQPMEAMYKALESGNVTNAGFVRDNAYLAVVFVTDEDDCSAADPELFDNTQTDINSPLGPIGAFRCFEFGLTCDIDDRTTQGLWQNCLPQQDPQAMLHPLSRYSQQLRSLKDQRMVLLAALAGPVTPSANGIGYDAIVGLDNQSYPELQYSCTTAVDGAVPGIRLVSLVQEFTEKQDLESWAYRSICDEDYTPSLAGVGNKLTQLVTTRCLPAPPKGCADIGAELGQPPLTACPSPNPCVAQCTAVQISGRYTIGELRTALPNCLHVLPGGDMDFTNTDPTLAYWGGHPETVDPNLPVVACWHITHEAECTQSNQAAVAVSQQSLPPPSTYLEVSCEHIYATEADCDNGVDDDEDCREDTEDPDCQ